VFVARNVSPRSTPRVCVLRGFLPGWVLPVRTTRRHGLARLPPNWLGWAERVVTFVGAAGKEGASTFLRVGAVRQLASKGTSLVLLPSVPSAAGGAPQRQVWLNPAWLMSDGEENGDPPGVEVPGIRGDGSFPPGGGSPGDHRHTSRSPTRRGVVLAVNGRGAGGARGPGHRGQHGPPAGAGCGADSATRLGARRAPVTPGPSGGGRCGGRPAPSRSRTTGRHVRAGREAQIPLRLYLPHWGTCLALFLGVWVGWRRGPIPIGGIGPAQRFPPFFLDEGRRR